MSSTAVARAWLLTRVDRRSIDAALSLLQAMTEDLSLATADSVSLRILSQDGQWLHPLAAYHPDPQLRAAMLTAMEQTAQTTASGFWRPVVTQRRPMRWHIPPGSIPEEASPAQADHLRRFPIRAILGVPLVTPGNEVIGGVALVRYRIEVGFTDEDERLLTEFARRAVLAVDLYRRAAELGDAELRGL